MKMGVFILIDPLGSKRKRFPCWLWSMKKVLPGARKMLSIINPMRPPLHSLENELLIYGCPVSAHGWMHF
jgi:hypothetical protein